MSIKLMARVWEIELDPPRRLVLLCLADHAKDDGSKCFPGVEHVAWKTGYSVRQVQRIITTLRGEGLLEAVAHEKGGRGRPVEYRIHLEKGVKKTPFRPPAQAGKGCQDDTLSPQKGDMHVTQTIIEPTDIYTLSVSIPKRITNNRNGDISPTGNVTLSAKAEETAGQNGDNGGGYDREFLAFWAAYPRKVGKMAAWIAWKKAKKRAGPDLLEKVLKAISDQKTCLQWRDPQYIPHPKTWLNQHRWEDESPWGINGDDYSNRIYIDHRGRPIAAPGKYSHLG